MSRHRTPLLLALVTGVASLVVGCSAGFGSTTSKPYAASDGVLGRSGDVRALNVLVVAPTEGGTGVLSMTLVNSGTTTETLTGITSSAGEVQITGPGEIGPGESVRFGAGTVPAATISGLDAAPGANLRLQLSFDGTDPIRLSPPVVSASGPYASLTPAAEPTPSPSGSASPQASPSPTG